VDELVLIRKIAVGCKRCRKSEACKPCRNEPRAIAGDQCKAAQDLNGGATPEQYEAAFYEKYNLYRTMIPKAENAAVIVGSMIPDWYESSAAPQGPAIDYIHRMTPLHIPRSFYVNGPRGGFDDNDKIHYNAAGSREIGKRMADAARSLCLLSGGTILTAPENLEATSTGQLAFTIPASNSPLYAIETKTLGTSDPWSREILSLDVHTRPGDRVEVPLPGFSGTIEVRVGSLCDGNEAASDPIQVAALAYPPAWVDLESCWFRFAPTHTWLTSSLEPETLPSRATIQAGCVSPKPPSRI
jgi:hypothetical protein